MGFLETVLFSCSIDLPKLRPLAACAWEMKGRGTGTTKA